jgi:hypothetical protein
VFTGPGYFVVRTDEGEGELIFDYTEMPAIRPDGWPRLVSNETVRGHFVFGGLVDVVRGVSEHVFIGRATRRGKTLDNWFALVRIDASVRAPTGG